MGFFDDINPFNKDSAVRQTMRELDPTASTFKPSTVVKTVIPVAALADATMGGMGSKAVDAAASKIGIGGGGGGGGAGTPAAPGQAPGLDMAQSDAVRAQQAAFIAALQAQANGTGPSVAQGQLQQATDANLRQSMALAQSTPGMGYQAALKNMLQNRAMAQQQAAGQSALLRNQEMLQGQQMLGNALGGMRGQDIQQSLGAQQGGLSQQQLSQNWALGQQQIAGQQKAQDNAFLGSLLQTGGAVAGAYFGGPGGAKVGQTAGNALGGWMANTPDVQPATEFSSGGTVPGRAATEGDAHANDTVPAMLSPGEVVLPRSVVQGEDAPDRAAEFVAALKSQKGDGGDIQKLTRLHQVLSDRLRRVEMAYGGRVC